MNKLEELLELLKYYGGIIVCTASLTPEQIDEARDGGRMYVDNDGFGFVWEFNRFPENEKEVELWEKWYPHPVDKEGLPSFDDFMKRLIEEKQRKLN